LTRRKLAHMRSQGARLCYGAGCFLLAVDGWMINQASAPASSAIPAAISVTRRYICMNDWSA